MSSFFGLVHVLALQLVLLRTVSSLNLTNEYLHHTCINGQGTYKKGSPFESNLNRLVRLISRSNYIGGFEDVAYGEGPDKLFVRLQCRADSYFSKCHSCFATALSGLKRRCPGNKGAIIWYDQCLLRTSTIHGFGKIDYETKFYMSNPNKVSGNPVSFNKEALAFLEKLTLRASSIHNVEGDGVSLVMYAAGEKKLGTKKLYALVQCTKDLGFDTCKQCLEFILRDFPKCCDGRQGGRVLSLSCNFRYELYPFLRT